MKKKGKSVTIYIDDELEKEIKKLMKEQPLLVNSFSQTIRELARENLKKKKGKILKI